MFGNLFKSKKERDLETLTLKYKQGEINHQEYKDRLKLIDEDAWYETLSQPEKDLLHLNKQFNLNEINFIEYKQRLKDLDKTKWLTLLSEEEKELYHLEEKYLAKQITQAEYEKEVATHKKEPYINVTTKVDFETGENYMEMEWNSFFIDYLKKHGYSGTEEEIVDKWVISLSTMIAAENDTVIVTDPDDLKNIHNMKEKTEFY